jgi:CelD/BcsL family acetyltransferase involved in cellulose biosynthesis
MAYDVREIASIEEFRKLEPVWNGLLGRSETNCIFMTYEWISAWIKHLLRDKSLCMLLAEKGGKVFGIAPFMFHRHDNSKAIIEFVGAPDSDFCDIIAAKEDKEGLIDCFVNHIKKRFKDKFVLDLQNVPGDSSTARIVRGLPNSVATFLIPYPILSVDSAEEKLSLVQSGIRRRKRRINKLSYHIASGTDEIRDCLVALFSQHTKRWNSGPMRSKFCCDDSKDFISESCNELSKKGWLRVAYLKLGEKIIAVQILYFYNSVQLFYLPSYDIDYKRYSPGIIIFLLNMSSLIEGGMRLLNFSIGDEPYKLHYANVVKANYELQVYGSFWEWLPMRSVMSLKGMVRRNRKLYYFLEDKLWGSK